MQVRTVRVLQRGLESYGFALLLLGAGLFAFLPFYWAITISIRNPLETFTVVRRDLELCGIAVLI